MCDAVGIGLETRVVAQVFAAYRRQQMMPMLFDRDVDRDIAVIGRVDAERRTRMAAVAGTRRNGARLPISLEMRGEGGVGGFLHSDFDQPALSGAPTLEQRRGYGGVEVDAGEKIDDCGSGLDRWAIGKAGRADQAHRSLGSSDPLPDCRDPAGSGHSPSRKHR